MSERTDWRSSEFQQLLHLKPVKVKIKSFPGKPAVGESKKPQRSDSTLLSFFALPPVRKLDPGLVDDLARIGRLVLEETDDPDEFFLILQAAEKYLPAIDDPVLRVERMARRLRTLKQKGKIKDVLVESGVLSIEDVEHHAIETGNWRRFMKMTRKKEAAVAA